MKKLSLVLVIAIVCLSLGVFSTSAFAEGETTGLSMTKIPDIDSASLGDTITYTYTITNMSTDNITGIALEDDKLGPIPLTTTSLEPGGSTTVTSTHVVVISDFTDPIAPEPIENVATVTGADLSGEPVTASASASVALSPYASMEVRKEADMDSASLHDIVTYTYTIINNGGISIDGIALEDDKLGPIPLTTTSLEPGESIMVTSTHVVVISDFTDPIAPDPIENVATVTGTDLSGEPVTASASASVALNPYASSLEVRKDADTGSASLHDTITYTYTIINSGDISINDIALEDDKLGPITLTTTSLEPGEEVEVEVLYTILLSDLEGEAIVNTASVQGTDAAGNPVSSLSNTVSVSLVIDKSLMTKAEVLKLSGVPGKGIDKAPGLQKPFNPKSRAAEHAGKKK